MESVLKSKQCLKKQNLEWKTTGKYSLLINSLLWLNYHSQSVHVISITVRSTAYHVLIKQGIEKYKKTVRRDASPLFSLLWLQNWKRQRLTRIWHSGMYLLSTRWVTRLLNIWFSLTHDGLRKFLHGHRCTLLMYPMKAILYLDSFDFSKFHQGKGFLEKGTVVLLLKTQLTVWEVLVLGGYLERWLKRRRSLSWQIRQSFRLWPLPPATKNAQMPMSTMIIYADTRFIP